MVMEVGEVPADLLARLGDPSTQYGVELEAADEDGGNRATPACPVFLNAITEMGRQGLEPWTLGLKERTGAEQPRGLTPRARQIAA